MKTILPSLAALATLLLLPSCQDFFHQEADGKLIITLEAPRPAATRAGTDLPDVGTFLLSVTNASGGTIYEGPYAQSPDEMNIPAGSYTICAVSTAFKAPSFETPQWGDTQVVSVPSGGNVTVALSCSQLNSGIRLDIDESFRHTFPGGILNADDGLHPVDLRLEFLHAVRDQLHPAEMLRQGPHQPLFQLVTLVVILHEIQYVRIVSDFVHPFDPADNAGLEGHGQAADKVAVHVGIDLRDFLGRRHHAAQGETKHHMQIVIPAGRFQHGEDQALSFPSCRS